MRSRRNVEDLGRARTLDQEWLSQRAVTRLEARIRSARRSARRGRSVLISVTDRLDGERDPSAIVLGSRRHDDDWFLLEQPDRDGAALAALGKVVALEESGPGRFRAVERRWRELSATALSDPPDGPSGCGLVATGGFAFAPDGASSPTWSGFASSSMVVPEISFARGRAETWLTVNALVGPDDTDADLLERIRERLASLRETALPLLDPSPTGRFHVHSPMPPAHYEEAVARAVQRIADGEFEKVVLAREVQVRAPTPHDPAAIYDVLRQGFPSCFIYAAGRGEATFIGASPELLIRRDGQRASTVALAGSTRRSSDPSVDDHLGEALLRSTKNRSENEIVARRIARALSPYAVWVTVAEEPVLVKVANIQHLGAPIRAQLAREVSAIELAGVLHPTPAVGGEPDEIAQRVIPALEGLDRGWYAGTVGWADAGGDGEFCVALRCALLRGPLAACYAGCGIVADSDPSSELAETEVKLQAMLPVLSG